MKLDQLVLTQEQAVNKVVALIDRDRQDVERIIREGSYKTRRMNFLKEQLAKRKPNAAETKHKTAKGIVATSFLYGVVQNAYLDVRDLRQRMDVHDALLMEYFLDYMPRDEAAERMPIDTAVMLETAALYFARSATYNAFEKQKDAFMRHRGNLRNHLMTKAGKKVEDLVRAFYERMFVNWTGRLKTPDIVNPNYDIAAEYFLSQFEHRELFGLLSVATTKEDVKQLRIVDWYVSEMMKDPFNQDFVGFLLNPLPAFKHQFNHTDFDPWSAHKRSAQIRQGSARESTSSLQALVKKYKGTHVTNITQYKEAEQDLRELTDIALIATRNFMYGELEQATTAHEQVELELKTYKQRLAGYKTRLTEDTGTLDQVMATLGGVFTKNFGRKDVDTYLKVEETVQRILAFAKTLDDPTINEKRDGVLQTVEEVLAVAAKKKSAYEDYYVAVSVDYEELKRRLEFNTQQEINELEELEQKIQGALAGAEYLNIDTSLLSGFLPEIKNVKDAYQRKVAKDRAAIAEISRSYVQLEKTVRKRYKDTTNLIQFLESSKAKKLDIHTAKGILKWEDQLKKHRRQLGDYSVDNGLASEVKEAESVLRAAAQKLQSTKRRVVAAIGESTHEIAEYADAYSGFYTQDRPTNKGYGDRVLGLLGVSKVLGLSKDIEKLQEYGTKIVDIDKRIDEAFASRKAEIRKTIAQFKDEQAKLDAARNLADVEKIPALAELYSAISGIYDSLNPENANDTGVTKVYDGFKRLKEKLLGIIDGDISDIIRNLRTFAQASNRNLEDMTSRSPTADDVRHFIKIGEGYLEKIPTYEALGAANGD